MTGGGPDLATILDWMEGRLDPDEAEAVSGAARTDPRVREIVAWMRGLRGVAAALPLVDPPPIVAQRLHQHFARWSAPAEAPPARPRSVDARLLFDSRRDVALVDVRSADGSDDADGVVHLAFTADVADVVLDVAPVAPDRVVVDGQVLLVGDGAGHTAFAVEATVPGAAPVRSALGDLRGRFRLELPQRVSSLRLDSGELAIHVALDVGPARP